MRPTGVTAIAILTWLRCAVYALAGLALLGIGHLSERLIAAAASDTFIERFAPGVIKLLGVGALVMAAIYFSVGLGLWGLRSWARSLTLVFAGIWLVLGLYRMLPHPTGWQGVRAATDAVIIGYLCLPDVRRTFLGPSASS